MLSASNIIKKFVVRNKIIILSYIVTLILSFFIAPWSQDSFIYSAMPKMEKIVLQVLFFGIQDIIDIIHYAIGSSEPVIMYELPIIYAYQKRFVGRYLSIKNKTGVEYCIVSYLLTNSIGYLSCLFLSCFDQFCSFCISHGNRIDGLMDKLEVLKHNGFGTLIYIAVKIAFLSALIILMYKFIIYWIDLAAYVTVYSVLIICVHFVISAIAETSLPHLVTYPIAAILAFAAAVILELCADKLSELLRPLIRMHRKDESSHLYSISEVISV